MDMNDYVLGNGVITPEQQRAIAGSLRSRDNMGAIMALTGDRAVAPVGQQFMTTANKGIQQGLTHNYYQGMLRANDEDRKARLKIAADANRLGYAKVAALRDATKPETKMDGKTREGLLGVAETAEAMAVTQKNYKPEWASSIPGMGPLKMTIARVAPALAPQGWEDFQAWRSDVERSIETILRHQLFGAALTRTEVERWKEITIDPNASPGQVMKWYERNMPRVQKELQRRAAQAAFAYPKQTQLLLQGGAPEGDTQQADALSYEVVQDE